MTIKLNKEDLEKLVIVGDRVLLKPKKPSEVTDTGLYLPPGVQEKEQLNSGYILKVGPGYPIPNLNEEDTAWKNNGENAKYIPLQAQKGDLAVYLQKSGYEILFNNEKYTIIPQSAILMLVRDDGLFD